MLVELSFNFLIPNDKKVILPKEQEYQSGQCISATHLENSEAIAIATTFSLTSVTSQLTVESRRDRAETPSDYAIAILKSVSSK